MRTPGLRDARLIPQQQRAQPAPTDREIVPTLGTTETSPDTAGRVPSPASKKVIALIGRGGMGEVYRATGLTLGQSVALTFLNPTPPGRFQLGFKFLW
jgi:hypothetical protein